ncbi:MAG: hypothetical protein EOO48_00520 [Flavobacterium sp.]|nr:MAG: hypothetical protein EOO48_00520 [Flavobacterium sp.]
MRRFFTAFFALILVVTASSFAAHKFYVAIFQINYNQGKQTMEITSRIFIDDLNKALEKKCGRPVHVADQGQTDQDIELMKKYIEANFTIEINGKRRPLVYRSSEIENNVLICYYSIREVSQVKSLEIQNKLLFDLVTEQQNIIQTNIYGKKSSLLLTSDSPSGTIKI